MDFLVTDGQHLCGQNGGVGSAVDGHGGHGHAAGHLHHGQQAVQTAHHGRLDGHADDRQGGVSGQDAAQMGSLTGTGDDDAKACLLYTSGTILLYDRAKVAAQNEDKGAIERDLQVREEFILMDTEVQRQSETEPV